MMRKVFALFAVFTFGLLAAACGSDDSDRTSSGSTTVASTGEAGDNNDADVTFAQGMIPHHAQALVMADMAIDASVDDRLTNLAEQIKAAQKPEIDQMKGWLEAWGEPVEAGSGGHGMGGMGGDAMGAGMMSDDEMGQMRGMSGTGFDRMWLTMMIRHHEGAIEMAEKHQTAGQSSEALALSKAIITAQQAEIYDMRTMLD